MSNGASKQSHAWRVVDLAVESVKKEHNRWLDQYAPLLVSASCSDLSLLGLPVSGEDLTDFQRNLSSLQLAVKARSRKTVGRLLGEVLRGVDLLGLDMKYGQWDALRQSIAQLMGRPGGARHAACLYLPRRILRGHEKVVAAARQNPDTLYTMDPRDFEKMIAFLFQKNGFEVALTSQTRDGGFDVFAVHKVLGISFKWLIECKRYAFGRNVSVDVARKLLGVLVSEQTNRGLIITTSDFTPDARDFASRNASTLCLWSGADLLGQLRACPA